MNQKLIQLSQRYAAALRKHLRQGPRASLKPAHDWGRQAAALGLETLDVAQMHEKALVTLQASGWRHGMVQRGQVFFTEAISSIEKTHRTALKAKAQLSQLNQTLGRRTQDLAASHRSLTEGISRRKAVEQTLKQRGRHNSKLLKKSHQLVGNLRRLAHQILSSQEHKRAKVSRELHDEIAQALLSIHVRLLTLKKEVEFNTTGLKNEIVSTQKLVEKSVKTLNQFAREFGIHHAS